MIGDKESKYFHSLMQTSKVIFHKTHKTLEDVGLYRGQPPLLYLLWEKDGQSKSELREALEVKPATISKMVSRLQNTGFVTSRTDENDLRVSRVYLTEKGKTVEKNVKEVFSSLNASTFEGFSEEELIEFNQYLKRVRENIGDIIPVENCKGRYKND